MMEQKKQALVKDAIWLKGIMAGVFVAVVFLFLVLHGRIAMVSAHAATFTVGSGSERRVYEITSDTEEKRTAKLIEIAPAAKKLEVEVRETDKETGKTYRITEIEPGAMAFHDNLKTVYIGENIRKIGNYAFYGCAKLSKVTIYARSLKKVGEGAFQEIKKGALLRVEAKDKKHYKQLKKLFKKSGTSNVKHQYRYSNLY